MGGVVACAVGIPMLMSTWAPRPLVALWLVAYVAMTGLAWVLLLRGSVKVENWWSASVGVLFATLPLTAHIFDPGTRSFWIAGMVCMIAVAFEVSTLPYLGKFEWRTGPAAIGIMLTVVGCLEVGPVGLLFAPMVFEILRAGDLVRATRESLEQSFAHAESESELAHEMARNDALTGLLNRRGLVAEIDRIAAAGDYQLMMFDADRFKAINDAYGHAAGDVVIRAIGQMLRERLGEQWMLGRLGGDEFVAVAPGAALVGADICEPVTSVVQLYGADSTISVGMSGGLAESRPDADPDRLLSMAGYAMRVAKRSGGGLARLDDQLELSFERMLEFTATELDPASFLALFQPIVTGDGTIVGCEALCRWQRPDGSILTPDQFLPLLSESGRMDALNEAMLRRGLEFASQVGDLANLPFVSVNIGSAHLADAHLVPLITDLLAEYGVESNRLMIEITENDLLSQDEAWQVTAQRLLDLGIMLAIDDFGSGYSNIDRLNQLPISHLKFDRSLTTSVSGPLGSVARGVVDFGAMTNIGIIGEGIETIEELKGMQGIGVELFQGYFFARPTEADKLEQLIRSAAEPKVVPRVLSAGVDATLSNGSHSEALAQTRA